MFKRAFHSHWRMAVFKLGHYRGQGSLDNSGTTNKTSIHAGTLEPTHPMGLYQGARGHLSVPASEKHLHGAVSVGAADGGRALPGRTAAEQKSGDGRDPLHFVQLVRAGLSGKPHRGWLGAR